MTHDSTKRQSLNRFGAAFFALLAITEVLQYGTQVILEKTNPAILEHPAFILVLSVVPVYFFALPVCVAILGKSGNNAPAEQKSLSFPRFLLATVISFGVSSIGNCIGNILTQLFSLVSGAPLTNPLIEIVTESNSALLFITTLIIAPIGEELIFRRLIVNHTRQYGEKFAVLLSGAMFAAFHTNIFQIPYAFLLGAVFAYIYIKTNKLRYTIILHAIINFFGGFLPSLVINFLYGFLQDMTNISVTDSILIIVVTMLELLYLLFLFGCGITVLILGIVKGKSIRLEGENEKVNVFKQPFIVLYFAACLVLTVVRMIIG